MKFFEGCISCELQRELISKMYIQQVISQKFEKIGGVHNKVSKFRY